MKILSLEQFSKREILDKCCECLKKGGSIACPTETSYALVVDALDPRAVRRLFQIKGREFTKPVHVLVSSVARAKRFVVWNSQADALAAAFWPGALTLVLPLRKEFMSDKSVSLLTAGSAYVSS